MKSLINFWQLWDKMRKSAVNYFHFCQCFDFDLNVILVSSIVYRWNMIIAILTIRYFDLFCGLLWDPFDLGVALRRYSIWYLLCKEVCRVISPASVYLWRQPIAIRIFCNRLSLYCFQAQLLLTPWLQNLPDFYVELFLFPEHLRPNRGKRREKEPGVAR